MTPITYTMERNKVPFGDLGVEGFYAVSKRDEHNKPNWNTADRSFYREYVEVVKDLKNNATVAESLLWQELRNKKLGVKFRRQHVIGSYIPDFVALSIKLIVEVDGKIHLGKKNVDAERTEWFKLNDYRVIRFSNEEIEKRIDRVIARIKMEISNLRNDNDPT